MSSQTDPIKLELMTHVERAVRPVMASLAKKMRMRKELLGHLTELYEQELARSGDGRLAARSAIERLGEPGELTSNLQATASWFEKWEAGTGAQLWPRKGESVVHHAVRMAGCVGAWASCWSLLIVGLIILYGQASDRPLSSWVVTFGSQIVGWTAAAFAVALLLHLLLSLVRAKRWLLSMVLIAATGLIPLAVAMLLGGITEASRGWPAMILVPAIFLGVATQLEHARRIRAEWTDLAIDVE